MPARREDFPQCQLTDVIGESISHGTMSSSWIAALVTVEAESPPGYASTVRLTQCDTRMSPNSPDATTAFRSV